MRSAGTAFALVLMLTTIGCDHVTKHAASRRLAGTPMRSYLGDTLRLQYAENPGAFLSLGEGLPDWARTGVLTVGAGIGLAAIAAAMFKFRWAGLARVGAILSIAGGVSNLIDRIAHGRVIDFMNVGIGSLRTGIFNVADVALMGGFALLVLAARTDRDRSPYSRRS